MHPGHGLESNAHRSEAKSECIAVSGTDGNCVAMYFISDASHEQAHATTGDNGAVAAEGLSGSHAYIVCGNGRSGI